MEGIHSVLIVKIEMGRLPGCLSWTIGAGIEVTERWQIELMKGIQMFRN